MKDRPSLLKPSLYTLLFVLLGGGAVIAMSKGFGIDFEQVWKSVRTVNPGLYLLAGLCFYSSIVLRGWRWRLLIESTADPGEEHPLPSIAACAQYILIGRFADSVSFAQAGNLYRSYLLAQAQGSSTSRLFGTTAAESVLDMLMIFSGLLGVGSLLVIQNSAAPVKEAMIAASVGAALVMAALVIMRRFGLAGARLLPPTLSRAYVQFHQGALQALGRQQLPLLLSLTGLGWLLSITRWYFVVLALGASVSLPMVLFISLANSVIASIPATPGGLGLVEPGVGALLALQLPIEMAVAITLSERFISYVSVLIIGGFVLVGTELQCRWRRGQ